MTPRFILKVSVAANIALAVGWLFYSQQTSMRISRLSLATSPATLKVKTNVVVRRQFFTWSEVESDDYPTYVTNLRDIGCPEQTLRDIIIADVNALYARRKAMEIISPEQQWWRPEPDTNLVQMLQYRVHELDGERRSLLAKLLGDNWETGDLMSLPRPTRQGVALDGPILGALSDDSKRAVQEIIGRQRDAEELLAETARKEGRSPSPAERAQIRQRMRSELAGVLSPTQLEEYLLRYSDAARGLRSELATLKRFSVTPDEFRALFRGTDAIYEKLSLLADQTDSASAQQTAQLNEQRENAIRLALGKDRYAQYKLLHDAGYRDAYALAEQANLPEAAPALFEINQAAAEELARIRSNTNIAQELRDIELKKAELEQLRATAQALGHDVPSDAPPAPPAPPPQNHVLKAGEGLNFIARLYGVDAGALRSANPNLNWSNIRPGDRVSVPIALLPVAPTQIPAQ